MRIAVPTNDGTTISPHFGRSAGFLVFEVGERRIQSREIRKNQFQHSHAQGTCGESSGGSEPHNHAGILSTLTGCDVVICAGMGARAADALKSVGITDVVFALPGLAEDTVIAYLNGSLTVTPPRFCQCSH